MLEFKSKTARQTSWKSQHQHGEGLEGRRNGWLVSQARVLLAVHRMGAGELQGESKEAQSVREILCRLWSVFNNKGENMEKGNVRLF